LHISLIFSNFVVKYKYLKTMKKSESTTRKETPGEELKRLRKENKSLKLSLDKTKDKLKETKAELKKKDVTTITLTKEQSELLSTLFPDIDIHSL